MADVFQLQRFVDGQEGVWEQAREELRAGRKRTHWIWFVFPQIAGLGSSAMAARYAMGSLAEAQAYLLHPVLGARLRELTGVVNGLAASDAGEVFGYPDDLKFRSSMTLFAEASGEEAVFVRALAKWFSGERDRATLGRVR